MVRTRDFLLYMLVVVFLVMAIVATLGYREANHAAVAESVSLTPGVETGEVISASETLDRMATIQRLQSKLAAGEGIIASAPPVFTSVDESVATSASSTLVTTGIVAEALVCATSNESLLRAWPTSGVVVTEMEGARLAQYVARIETLAGTSTETVVSTTTLLVLPIAVQFSQSQQCVSDIVGISPNGTLLLNDARLYANAAPNKLLGYAFDGFPIYGPASESVTLDNCGGLDTGFAYQYHVRPGEPTLLGCFSGLVQNPTL